MALQVWLPLNGDLNNQGLSDVAITNSNATVNTSGKIGSCYAFNNSYLGLTPGGLSSTDTDFSICTWVYFTNTSGIQTIYTQRIAADTNGISIYIVPSAGRIYFDDGARWTSTYSTFTVNTWYHVCYTRDNTGKKYYINGTLVGSTPNCGNRTHGDYGCIGKNQNTNTAVGYTNNLQGYLNDFRIYNHCLSPKEVKEISKGLILHYPLNDPYLETTSNLVYQPVKTSVIGACGWDQTLHKDAIGVSNWSTGYNAGVTSPATGFHACWKMIDNIPTIVFQDLNSVYNQSHRWLGVAGSLSANAPSLINGATYTISFDAKANRSCKKVSTGLYYKKTTDGGNSFYDGLKSVSLTTNWERYSVTFTNAVCVDIYRVYFYGERDSIEGISYVRNVQLEIKDHATPFVNGSRNDDTVYDCSGYSHNGTKSGDFFANTDTPRYLNSLLFDGKTVDGTSNTLTGAAYITGPCVLASPTAITVAWWDKINKYGRGGIFETTAKTSNYLDGTDYNTATVISNWDTHFRISNGSSYIDFYNNILRDATWHHYAITYNGATAILYRDGVAVQSGALTGALPSFNGLKIGIGRAGGVYRQINRYASDFRIYVTALSADDVKELYNTSATIADNGTPMTYSFIEE